MKQISIEVIYSWARMLVWAQAVTTGAGGNAVPSNPKHGRAKSSYDQEDASAGHPSIWLTALKVALLALLSCKLLFKFRLISFSSDFFFPPYNRRHLGRCQRPPRSLRHPLDWLIRDGPLVIRLCTPGRTLSIWSHCVNGCETKSHQLKL